MQPTALKELWTSKPFGSEWHEFPSQTSPNKPLDIARKILRFPSYRCIAWSVENIIAYAPIEGYYVPNSEDARQHVIHLIRPDEPYEHTTIVTDHKSPIVHLEWSPLHAWKMTSFLLSADRLGHIEIWQPKEEFVNEWRLFSTIELEPLVMIKWLNYPRKYNLDAPAVDANDFRRKFFTFDEDLGEDMPHHTFISLSVSGKLTFAYHVHNNWILLTHDLKNYGAPISHADLNFYSMQSGVLAVSGFNSSLRHTITIYNFQINIKESQLTCTAIQQIEVVSADMPLAVDSLHREHMPVLDQMDESAGADDDDEFNPAAINLLETEANTGPVKSPIHIAFSPIHWTVFFVVSVAANGDCFLEKWQWTKTQFNFDPSFDLTTAPPTTLDEYRPSYIKLSSRCNPDIVAKLLPDQRDPRVGTDFVTDLKVTENNLAVLSFIDGHVELYDGNSLKLVGTFEGHRSEMFVEDGFGIKQESETVDDILGIDMGDMDVKNNNKRKFDLMAHMSDVDTQPNVKRRKITSIDSQNALVDTTHLISSLGLDAGSRMNKTSKRPPVPVSVAFSPNNNCCMAVLYYNTELQLVPLAPVYPSQSSFTPARWIANLFQSSIARHTDFWDVLALLCTWTHLPKYRGMHKEVLLYLLQDWEYLQPAYKSFVFAQHEAIKSAIYRSVPNMTVNYANSQTRLFINYMLQIFRFSIRNTTVIQTNWMDREDEVDPTNQNAPAPFIESLGAQNTNIIVPFDKEAMQTLSPFVDWFLQYCASTRKGLQSFIVRHSPQQLQHGSLLASYLQEFHQLEVKPVNLDQFFAVAPDEILDYGVDLICDRDTYFTLREVTYYASLYARQKYSTAPNPLAAVAKTGSAVPGAVPPQQQQAMQQKRAQFILSLQSINRLANQMRRMLYAFGVRADSFSLDDVPKRMETITSQLMNNLLKQQRQALTVYNLSQTVPAVLDLMPHRFKVLETNAIGASGYLVDHKVITDASNTPEQSMDMHFYHLHNTFYLKRMKLKDVQASDMLDVVTHIKLQPKDYVRQCTRCNRISALINKSTVQWYNQWVYACPVCAGRWKKVPIE